MRCMLLLLALALCARVGGGALDTPTHDAAVWLTVSQTPNGVGALVLKLVYAKAYARLRGWNFGGVHAARLSDSHFVSGNAVVGALFGDPQLVLALGRVPPDAPRIVVSAEGVELLFDGTLARPVWVPPPGSVVHLPNIDNFFAEHVAASAGVPLDALLSPSYLAELRAGAAAGLAESLAKTNHFDDAVHGCSSAASLLGEGSPPPPPPRRLNVAAHVRRGDASRGPPMEFYLSVFSALAQLYPGRVSVHIFAEDMSEAEQLSWRRDGAAAGFANESWQMHVSSAPPLPFDDADTVAQPGATQTLLEHVAHFAEADVFVASVSMLSHSAAFFSRGCVVYTQARDGDLDVTSIYLIHRPLLSWFVNDGAASSSDELRLRLQAFLPSCLPDNVGS